MCLGRPRKPLGFLFVLLILMQFYHFYAFVFTKISTSLEDLLGGNRRVGLGRSQHPRMGCWGVIFRAAVIVDKRESEERLRWPPRECEYRTMGEHWW